MRRALLTLVHLAGIATLFVPFITSGRKAGVAHAGDAPILVALLIPALLAVAVGEIAAKRLDSKTIALLGVLCGLNAVLRIPGSLGGASLMFFLPIVCGVVFGATFGFLLGSLSFAVSAVVTGGLGPWLPFQMFACGWVGAGGAILKPLLPHPKMLLAMLVVYGYAAGFFFGVVMDLWFFPWLAPSGSFVGFYLATSLAWDAGRAIANAVLCATLGLPAIRMLRRYRDKASSTVVFEGKSLESLPG